MIYYNCFHENSERSFSITSYNNQQNMCTDQFFSWKILKEAFKSHNIKFKFLQLLHQNSLKTHFFFLIFEIFRFLMIAFSNKKLKNQVKHAIKKFKKKKIIKSSNEKIEKIEKKKFKMWKKHLKNCRFINTQMHLYVLQC